MWRLNRQGGLHFDPDDVFVHLFNLNLLFPSLNLVIICFKETIRRTENLKQSKLQFMRNVIVGIEK